MSAQPIPAPQLRVLPPADEPEPVIPEDVVLEACRRFGLPLERLRSAVYRSRRHVVARRWVIRTLHDAGHSSGDIGEALNIDHTTVLHHLRHIAAATQAALEGNPGE